MAEETPRELTFGIAGVTEQDLPFRLGSKVLQEISDKIGHKIELITLPIKRAKIMLLKGQIDAELVRIIEYQSDSESLIMISEPIAQLPFYAYSIRSDIKTKTPQDIDKLKQLKIVGLRGQEFPKVFFNDSDLFYVDSVKSGFLFLHKERADVFIVDGISASTALNTLEQEKLGINRLEPPLAIINRHTFFSPENAEIAKKYEQALIEIKKEGIYDKIFRETK